MVSCKTTSPAAGGRSPRLTGDARGTLTAGAADPASTDVLVRRPGSRGDAGEIDLAPTDRDRILVPSHFAWPELIAVMQQDLRNGREQRTILILRQWLCQ